MGLVGAADLAGMIVCPHCKSSLIQNPDAFHCRNQDCRFSGESAFPIIQQWPVLVDFDDSILDRKTILATSARSVVTRSDQTSLGQRVKNALLPPNTIASTNVQRMIDLLKTRTPQPLVVDIGGGSVGTASQLLHNDPAIRLISFDVYASPSVQFIADGHKIPLADGSVDGVVIQAVLEHVLEPWVVVSEIHRILKDGGIVYSEIPFMQQVHEGPYDFTRFSHSGHRYLYKRFRAIDSGLVTAGDTQLTWTVEHTARGIFRSRAAGRIAKLGFFWLRFVDKLIPEPYRIDNAWVTYFFGEKMNQAIKANEMPALYKGAQ